MEFHVGISGKYQEVIRGRGWEELLREGRRDNVKGRRGDKHYRHTF